MVSSAASLLSAAEVSAAAALLSAAEVSAVLLVPQAVRAAAARNAAAITPMFFFIIWILLDQ